MSAGDPRRIFVAAGSLQTGRLRLEGEDATRALKLGLRPGSELVVLDDSGWETDVRLTSVDASVCEGEVLGRRLATERRTKVSLYQGLLHPSDFRRLLAAATALGAVAFVPVIPDGSVVPMLGADGAPEGEAEWPRLVREAAESARRGRLPQVGATSLLDQALDGAARGGTRLMIDPGGEPLAPLLAERPFSIDLFLPPPGGFTAEERARARARGVTLAAPPQSGSDPIQPALTTLDRIYALLEAEA